MSNHKYRKYKKKYQKLKTVMNMKSTIDSLMASTDSFAFVDIGPTNYANLLFTKENITNNTFEYYGIFEEKIINEKLIEFLNQITDDKTSKKITKFMDDIIDSYTMITHKAYIWLTMRIFHPSHSFDIPRWHADGYYYETAKYVSRGEPQLKLAGVLTGPATLFKLGNQEMFTKYLQLQRKLYADFDSKDYFKEKDITNRKIINDELQQYATVAPKQDQVVIFKVGMNGAIHSEPKMDTKRLFYSIVTGTHDEILDLAMRWGKSFNDKD